MRTIHGPSVRSFSVHAYLLWHNRHHSHKKQTNHRHDRDTLYYDASTTLFYRDDGGTRNPQREDEDDGAMASFVRNGRVPSCCWVPPTAVVAPITPPPPAQRNVESLSAFVLPTGSLPPPSETDASGCDDEPQQRQPLRQTEAVVTKQQQPPPPVQYDPMLLPSRQRQQRRQHPSLSDVRNNNQQLARDQIQNRHPNHHHHHQELKWSILSDIFFVLGGIGYILLSLSDWIDPSLLPGPFGWPFVSHVESVSSVSSFANIMDGSAIHGASSFADSYAPSLALAAPGIYLINSVIDILWAMDRSNNNSSKKKKGNATTATYPDDAISGIEAHGIEAYRFPTTCSSSSRSSSTSTAASGGARAATGLGIMEYSTGVTAAIPLSSNTASSASSSSSSPSIFTSATATTSANTAAAWWKQRRRIGVPIASILFGNERNKKDDYFLLPTIAIHANTETNYIVTNADGIDTDTDDDDPRMLYSSITFGIAALLAVLDVVFDGADSGICNALSVHTYILSAAVNLHPDVFPRLVHKTLLATMTMTPFSNHKPNHNNHDTDDSQNDKNPLEGGGERVGMFQDPGFLEDMGDVMYLVCSLVDGALLHSQSWCSERDAAVGAIASAALWFVDASLYLRSDFLNLDKIGIAAAASSLSSPLSVTLTGGGDGVMEADASSKQQLQQLLLEDEIENPYGDEGEGILVMRKGEAWELS